MTAYTEPTLHEMIYALVEQRHPSPHLNASQVVRLGVLKTLEEALELAAAVALPHELSGPIDVLTKAVRRCFRERDWLAGDWTQQGPVGDSLRHLKAEMADTYAALAHLERAVVVLTDEEWSVQAAALAKAVADRKRP